MIEVNLFIIIFDDSNLWVIFLNIFIIIDRIYHFNYEDYYFQIAIDYVNL
jgi:hypothetical protein